MSSTPSSQPSHAPPADVPRKRRYTTAVIALVLIGTVVAFGLSYGFSYQSVRGLTVEIVQVSRTYTPGSFASIQFDVTAHLWSSNSLDMSLDQVQFQLTVDSVPFSTVSGRGSSFSPYSYLGYNLRFLNSNAQDASLLGERSSHRITLSVGTFVRAGIYSASLSPSTSRTVVISRVADVNISPTVVEECQTISRDVLLSQRGGVTIRLSSSPDTLFVSIRNSQEATVFGEETTNFDSVIRLPAGAYSVQVQNPGFFCGGADNQVSGSIEFWHEQTSLV